MIQLKTSQTISTATNNISRTVRKDLLLIATTFPSVILAASVLALSPTIGIAFAATLTGTNGADTLRGTNNSDTIYGKGGNDRIYGYAGNDKLYGGRGNDRIDGGNGNDYISGWYGGNTLFGGKGNDRIYSTGPSSMSGSSFPMNEIHGNSGDDYIKIVSQNARVYGEAGGDTIIAIGGDEELVNQIVYGGSGRDVIETDYVAYGDGGNDRLKGRINAALYGGDGDDILEASRADHIRFTGGPGADHFNCGGVGYDVTIRDFNPSEGDTKTEDCENF
jgi:Ca2+-binding RTX toxin-like protein